MCHADGFRYLRQAITLCANLAEGPSSVPSCPVFLACPDQFSRQEALLPTSSMSQMVFSILYGTASPYFAMSGLFLSFVHAGFVKVVILAKLLSMMQHFCILYLGDVIWFSVHMNNANSFSSWNEL
jgi:hypothetical protein